jgi:hypothetical protein
VSEVKVPEFRGTEPAKPVVLAGTLVHDSTIPVIYRPNGELDAWFPADSFGKESSERWFSRLPDSHSELFRKLSDEGVPLVFHLLDVTAREVPDVGVRGPG